MKKEIRINASGIESFLMCGHAYYLGNILRVPSTVSIKVMFGRIMHDIIHADARNYIETKKFLTPKILKDMIPVVIKANIEKEPNFECSTSPEIAYMNLMKDASSCLNNYISLRDNEMKDLYKPQYAEDVGAFFDYVIETEKYNIIIPCKIDVILENNIAVEYKFKMSGGKIPTYFNLNKHLQSNLYNIALDTFFGKKHQIKLIMITPEKTKITTNKMDDVTKEKTTMILERIADAIDKEVFLPSAQDESKSWMCYYCGLKDACVYKL